MILGTGVDLVEIERIARLLREHGERFRRMLFTPEELAFCRARGDRPEHYAARVAAKEAAMKALGTGWAEGVGWRQIETRSEPSGRPGLVLSGRAAELAAARGATRLHLSLSHTERLAVAFVVLEGAP